MAKQVKTEQDVTKFNEEYSISNKELCKVIKQRLWGLHHIYDEAQGYATMILERDNDNNRYLAFKYLAGVAVAMSKQEDSIVDDFLKYGQRGSAFWMMVQLEKDLRTSEQGLATNDVKKSLSNRLRPYKKSSTHITEACNNGRIGTSVLYPMMAILHDYTDGLNSNEEYTQLVKNFFDTQLGIDITPYLSNPEQYTKEIFADAQKGIEKSDQFGKNSKIEAIKNICKPINSLVAHQNGEDVLSEFKSRTFTQKTKDALKIQEKEELEKALLNDKNLLNNRDFLSYATDCFLKENDYSKFSLTDFAYTLTKSVMGQVCEEQEIKPFFGADSPKKIQAVFEGLENDLQFALIKNIYAPTAVAKLLSDLQNINNLEKSQKEKIAIICNQNEILKTQIKNQQKNQAEKISALKKLNRLSRRNEKNSISLIN